MKYPTRNGISISSSELELPPSRLNLSNEKNFNNHHLEWTRKAMAKSAILQTLRDLEWMQERQPLDVHNWIHQEYSPPKMPTPSQAMARIAMGYDIGEALNVRQTGSGYIKRPLTEELWDRLTLEYNQIGDVM